MSVGNRESLGNARDVLADFENLVRRFAGFDSDDLEEASLRMEYCDSILAPLTTGVFRIVVMGEVKKGKSTLINTLLGRPRLLPVEVDVATSTIFKITYGLKERVTVFFNEESEREPLEIAVKEIEDFGTELGNPSNEKQVDFIAIELPLVFLKDGVCLIDTPGVGGLFRRHRNITFEYAPKADLIIFVVDSVESVIGKEEVDFLKELKQQNPYIVFVQTKTDMATSDQVNAIKERNLQILSESLGVAVGNIPYFCLSSRLKEFADETKSFEDLEASGFADFLACYNQAILPARKKIVVNRFFPDTYSKVLNAKSLAEDRLRIAREGAANNRPMLEKYDEELKEALKQFESWRQDEWPILHRSFRSEISKLERESLKKIDQATSSDIAISSIIEAVRRECKKLDDVLGYQETALSELAASCNMKINEVLSNFERSVETKLTKLTGDTLKSLLSIDEKIESDIKPRKAREIDATTSRSVREAYLGNMHWQGIGRKAAMIGGLALGTLVTGGLLPLALAKLAVIAGGTAMSANELWGYVRGFKISRERQTKDAIRALENALQETCNIANRTGRNAFIDLAGTLRDATEDATFQFQREYKKTFEARRNEIDSAMKRTVAEADAEIKRKLILFKEIDEQARVFGLLEKQLATSGAQ